MHLAALDGTRLKIAGFVRLVLNLTAADLFLQCAVSGLQVTVPSLIRNYIAEVRLQLKLVTDELDLQVDEKLTFLQVRIQTVVWLPRSLARDVLWISRKAT